MSKTLDEQLEKDANLSKPLQRVAYEAGMMLGLEATRDEQSYHRQRLNRHQYWLQGSGTLVGMAVSLTPKTSTAINPIKTQLNVSPGIGIDGLGREVQIHEDYCVDLGEWLIAQTATDLYTGYDEDADLLWLKVTVRYETCDIALQPVLARKLNLSTDAVQPSRIADSISLELSAELPPEEINGAYQPWAVHKKMNDELPSSLTDAEKSSLDAAALAGDEIEKQLQVHARLLHALSDTGLEPVLPTSELENGSRLLLARLSLSISSLNSILDANQGDLVINPTVNNIQINNLVRPFLTTASQLAYVQRLA